MKYLAITAVLCLILAGASFAGNVTITEVLTGGNLTLTMPNAFSLAGIEIRYYTQEAIGWATYTVEDSRGSGAGWNLGFQINQFLTAGTPQRSLLTNAFSVYCAQANIAATYGQAVNVTNGPKTLTSSGKDIGGTEGKCITTAVDYGMGKYTILTGHTLGIGASTYAGTYTATLTATLNNVP